MRNKFIVVSIAMSLFVLGLLVLPSRSTPVTAATPEATAAATQAMSGMSGGMGMATGYSTNDLAPLAKGFFEGKDVFFIHPEASDADVADVLTKMMGPKVLTVPGLGKIPADLLGNVFVFTNGVKDMGPLGFQPDVFDSIPGDKSYTPLREISLVTWQEGSTAQVLKSIADIEAAKTAKKIVVKRTGVVVNMPILVWPNGKR